MSVIVNGFPVNPIELCPFDCLFAWQNIFSWWHKVGLLPMIWNVLNDEEVRQQLGGDKTAVGDQRD